MRKSSTALDPGRRRLPTSQLIFDILFYGYCCQSKLLTRHLPAFAQRYPQFQRWVLEPLFRHLVFDKFAGGETLDECFAKAAMLQERWGSETAALTFIVDEAAEDLEGEDAFDIALQGKLQLFHRIEECSARGHVRVPFVPLKCSALLPGESLERLTLLVRDLPDSGNRSDGFVRPNEAGAVLADEDTCTWAGLDVATMEALIDQADAQHVAERGQTATGGRPGPLRKGIARLHTILADARRRGVAVLLDAEQSDRQPALDLLFRLLALTHNRCDESPVLYNTYQCYLRRAETALARDLSFCRAHNLRFAVKLVRGAYLLTEQTRSSGTATGPPPVWSSKADVDRNYDTLAHRLLDLVAQGDASRPSLLFATHNRESATRLCVHMTRGLGLPANHPDVHFAQILGMADLLTIGLANGGLHVTGSPSHGVRVSKLLLYGDVSTLLPWLLRRLQENQVRRDKGSCWSPDVVF